MTERPILFNGEMVRQVLADRKTQTRRVAKGFQGCDSTHTDGPTTCRPMLLESGEWGWDIETGGEVHGPLKRCPYGKPGDLLWVRETFAIDDYRYITGPLPKTQPADVFRVDVDDFCERRAPLYYRADGECCEQIPECQCRMDGLGRFWRPSIHMPRWASRLTLRVADVRVERVQDISEEDAKAEGTPSKLGRDYITPCDFRELWDSINGKREGCSWEANPWAWVVSFERAEADE